MNEERIVRADEGIGPYTQELEELTPEQLGGEIRLLTAQARRMALSYGIQIGYRLKLAHEKVGPHGWADWLKKATDFSAAAASRFESLYEGYGADQGSLFGVGNKFPTLEKLSVSNALRLLAVPEEEREQVAEEVGAEKLSARELDKVLKERDEARKQLQDATARLEDTQKSLAAAQEAEGELTRKLSEAKKDVLAADEMAEKNERELRERIKELESRPIEVAVEKDEKAVEEAAEAARAKAEAEAAEKIAALQKKLEKAEKEREKLKDAAGKAESGAADKIAAAEREAAAARGQIEALRKQLAASDRDVAEFIFNSRTAQASLQAMLDGLAAIGPKNPETARKLNAGLKLLVERIGARCAEIEAGFAKEEETTPHPSAAPTPSPQGEGTEGEAEHEQ